MGSLNCLKSTLTTAQRIEALLDGVLQLNRYAAETLSCLIGSRQLVHIFFIQ